MTNAQIKKAQTAKIKQVLKASGNFSGKALTTAVKLTYEAIQTPANERSQVQNVMISAFSKWLLAQEQTAA